MTLEQRHHRERQRRIIDEGRQAREMGESRAACPYPATQGEFERHHWWLAGWHDKDQELDTRTATA